MGILDITDNFYSSIEKEKNMNGISAESLMSNKLHEQPLVSFVEKNNEKEVIYREEV